MLTALTRAVSPSLAQCALSFIEREPIDVALAMRQHQGYEECLRHLGLRLLALPPEPELPDAVFVEDTAVVVDEVAVLTAPLLDARRREVASVASALAPYRPLRSIEGTGTLEGGDVMRSGRTVYAGVSARSNRAGIAQLAAALEPFGYTVEAVEFTGCLHLKSACCFVGPQTILANRDWVDTTQLPGLQVVEVALDEPAAANALAVAGHVLLPAAFPRTAERLEQRGFQVIRLDVSELQKAEAGVTCCSVIFQ